MSTTMREPDTSVSLPWLLRLYPETWRSRYGAEFADLLAARPPSRRDRLDIVRGAIDARKCRQRRALRNGTDSCAS